MTQETQPIIRDGIIRETTGYQSAMLPSPCPQNHASNLLALPNGDLLCTWFGGSQEGMADISIYLSRLKKGTNLWSPAEKLSNDATRSEQNPMLFRAPDSTLWLLWTAQHSGNQDTAIVRYRQSHDDGNTWGDIHTLIDEAGTFIRHPIVITENGNWLLPVFYCVKKAGEKWVGNHDYSAVKISSNQGKTWRSIDVPNSLGCVHMNIVPLANQRLVALYRSRWADFIYRSISTDGANSWTPPETTNLPNNNSSIQAIALHDGRLALMFNFSSAHNATERRTSLYDEIEDTDNPDAEARILPNQRSAFWGAPRAPMSLAISEDEGKTWQVLRHLDEGDGYCMTNNSQDKRNREFSYPSIIQTPDNNLHISYTYFRQAIKYVQLSLEEIS